jgi:hypothetical protein
MATLCAAGVGHAGFTAHELDHHFGADSAPSAMSDSCNGYPISSVEESFRFRSRAAQWIVDDWRHRARWSLNVR